MITIYTIVACFAAIPPLAGIYGDGAIWRCYKTLYPWVFVVVNAINVVIAVMNQYLWRKHKPKMQEQVDKEKKAMLRKSGSYNSKNAA
jgi:hypothetical protein